MLFLTVTTWPLQVAACFFVSTWVVCLTAFFVASVPSALPLLPFGYVTLRNTLKNARAEKPLGAVRGTYYLSPMPDVARPVRACRRGQAGVSASSSSGRQRTRPPPEGQLHSVYLFGIPSLELRRWNSGTHTAVSGYPAAGAGVRPLRVPQGTIVNSHGARARGKRVSARIIFAFGAPQGRLNVVQSPPAGLQLKRGGHGPPANHGLAPRG